MKVILILALFCFSSFAQELELSSYVEQLNSRQSQVEEFRYIKQIAGELGIKHVYMFGGTAAAWGHYVRWDMRRELGIEKLQPQRFDYDYTNIFRANQDFDVVIDGTVAQAEALEARVQQQFNYFSGTRPTWEVRLLNEQRADKDSILGTDFQNQHTDSHSTGLIEMMDCEGYECIKDVRDINNPRSAFLMDVFEAKLHYYYSESHKETKRFKAGMNPEILSVVRYFTKAVQYGLERRPEDIKLLQHVIDRFNPNQVAEWDGYVNRWLEKNAKKLIVNAVDMEFSQNLLEKTGLKKKLIAIGSQSDVDSMAWWLNKQALKSKPLGQGQGETAAVLFKANSDGDIIVAHETKSFPAYESITKAHNGLANVLISRKNIKGETAALGNGHYTRIGREGAVGSGLTIRYILNPLAREGSDFKISNNDFVVIKNRKALTVIYENLNLGFVDYFKNLATGLVIDSSDKGVREKVRRRVLRKSQNLSDIEIEAVIKVISSTLDSGNKKALPVVQEWFSLPLSSQYPEVLIRIIQSDNLEASSYAFNELITRDEFRSEIDIKKIILQDHGKSILKISDKNFRFLLGELKLSLVEFFQVLTSNVDLSLKEYELNLEIDKFLKEKSINLTRAQLLQIEKIVLSDKNNHLVVDHWARLIKSNELLFNGLESTFSNGVKVFNKDGEIIVRIPQKDLLDKILIKGNKFLKRQGIRKFIILRSVLIAYSAAFIAGTVGIYNSEFLSDFLVAKIVAVPAFLIGVAGWAALGVQNLDKIKDLSGSRGTRDIIPFYNKQTKKLLRQLFNDEKIAKSFKFSKSNILNTSRKPVMKDYDFMYSVDSDDFEFLISTDIKNDYIDFKFSPSSQTVYSLKSYKKSFRKILNNLDCSKLYKVKL